MRQGFLSILLSLQAYDEELKVLLDDVPPRPTALIKSIIKNEFACPLASIFETFKSKSFGRFEIQPYGGELNFGLGNMFEYHLLPQRLLNEQREVVFDPNIERLPRLGRL